MRIRKQKVVDWFAGCLRGVFIVSVCLGLPVPAAGDNTPGSSTAGATPQTILLLPFKDLAAIYGSVRNIRSPINGRVFISGPVDDKAPRFMDAQLHTLMLEKESITVIPSERASGIVAVFSSQKNPIPERELWVEVGRALGADAVLGGFIYRFKNRTGRNYGVDDAASIAFDLHLVRVADSRVRWSGRVDETQQPLSNNLFTLDKFVRRGGKWVTSREMAQDELQSLVADMPLK